MKVLRFEGPARRLRVAGQVVERGATVELDDDTARRVLANRRIHVSEVKPEPAPYRGLLRAAFPTEPDTEVEIEEA